MTDPERLLACAPNFRSVTPVMGRGGRRLAAGRLYRADAVVVPTPEDHAVLARLGIALVFDLRSAAERARVPGGIWVEAGAEVRPIDMLAHVEGSTNPWSALKPSPDRHGAGAAMQTLYAGFPAALHGQLRPIAEAMIGCGEPVLIHCTAGKDRTGFAIAILLAALGVSMDEIMADYLASLGRDNAQAREETRQLISGRLGFDLDEQAIDRLMTVEESYLAASFQAVDQQFGGTAAYLATAGITGTHIAALESLLLA
jgi:protein-tyrosine phosphatase